MRRNLAITVLSIAISAVLWPGAAIAQQAATDASAALPTDPAVTVGTLPNGLRYYIRENRFQLRGAATMVQQ